MIEAKLIMSFTILELSRSPMRTKWDRYCHEIQVRQLETEYNKLLEDREILYQRSLKDIGLREQMNKAIETLEEIKVFILDVWNEEEFIRRNTPGLIKYFKDYADQIGDTLSKLKDNQEV